MFIINGRFESHRVTGMQRYAIEVSKRFKSEPRMLRPSRPLKGLKGHIWEQAILPSISKKELLWSPCNTGPVWVRRHVITIHDLIPLDHPEWYSARYSFLYRSLMPPLAKRAEHIIAVSAYTKERIIRLLKVPEKKITVIPNGVSESFTPQSVVEVNRIREKLKIPTGPYFLSVCSLEPRKNLSRLLDAWARVSAQMPEATLVLAGARGRSAVFKKAVLGNLSSRILLTGYVHDDDLPALYSGAHAFVYPSLYEGFGLPVVEALASGTRVISSNSTSIAELAGPSLSLVDPLSAASIAAEMLKSLSSITDMAAATSHASQFSWDKSAAMTESLLISHCQ